MRKSLILAAAAAAVLAAPVVQAYDAGDFYMRVGANGAPWRCLVSGDGSNPSLMFVGNEGQL